MIGGIVLWVLHLVSYFYAPWAPWKHHKSVDLSPPKKATECVWVCATLKESKKISSVPLSAPNSHPSLPPSVCSSLGSDKDESQSEQQKMTSQKICSERNNLKIKNTSMS